MEEYLRKIVAHHPEKDALIVRLAREDPDFRSICEDMDVAEQAMARWAQMPSRAAEYAEILDELKQELLAHLSGKL